VARIWRKQRLMASVVGEQPRAAVPASRPRIVDYLTTVDHKKIGVLYLVTSIIFLLVAGVLALVIRAELAFPELQFVDEGFYNQLFTMHGTGMIFFAIVPLGIGFANYVMPLQLGAPDVAFPRLNALTYWLYLGGGLIAFSGFLTAGGAAAFGWYGYTPLSTETYSPGAGGSLWIMGLILSGTSGILGAVNFIATIFTMRAPGLTMFRMSIFTWNILVTSLLIILTFPVLTAALVLLFIDRTAAGGAFFGPQEGANSILWQHLFWFFGHPEVYIMALPFFGVVSEIVPVFSGKRIFGYRALVFATILIGAYSFSVWAHHMFTTGAVSNLFFGATSFLIAVPTGVKFFTWIATMWRGRIRITVPMLFIFGFLFQFLIGGITGVFLASPPIDYQVQDTYYVVAHMHYVLFGGSAFAAFAAFYFWIPKISGRMLDATMGKLHFWTLVLGFNLTFFPMHILGLQGMARRVADYPDEPGWTLLNVLASIGSVFIALAVLLFAWNVIRSVWMGRGEPAGDDPWRANSLEWATTSPPPHHNFHSLPRIRSERPVWDARQASASGEGRAGHG
jgi:cytochrome c oxidase subunit 1